MGCKNAPWVWRTPKSHFWAGVVIPVWCAKDSSAHATATARYPPLRVHVRFSSLSTVLLADKTGGWREGHGHGVGWVVHGSPFLSQKQLLVFVFVRVVPVTAAPCTIRPHTQADGIRPLNPLTHSPTRPLTCTRAHVPTVPCARLHNKIMRVFGCCCVSL